MKKSRTGPARQRKPQLRLDMGQSRLAAYLEKLSAFTDQPATADRLLDREATDQLPAIWQQPVLQEQKSISSNHPRILQQYPDHEYKPEHLIMGLAQTLAMDSPCHLVMDDDSHYCGAYRTDENCLLNIDYDAAAHNSSDIYLYEIHGSFRLYLSWEKSDFLGRTLLAGHYTAFCPGTYHD